MTNRLIAILALALAVTAHASGPQRVRFRQDVDCTPAPASYEMAYEPAATAGALPKATATLEVVAMPVGFACAVEVESIEPIFGVGTYRFWLRSVASDGTKSAWSNSKDTSVPFAAPVLAFVGN